MAFLYGLAWPVILGLSQRPSEHLNDAFSTSILTCCENLYLHDTVRLIADFEVSITLLGWEMGFGRANAPETCLVTQI